MKDELMKTLQDSKCLFFVKALQQEVIKPF